MKVFVTTKAKPFQSEVFLGVYSTKKKAELALRNMFPYMRCTKEGSLVSDKNMNYLLFIREEDVQ